MIRDHIALPVAKVNCTGEDSSQNVASTLIPDEAAQEWIDGLPFAG